MADRTPILAANWKMNKTIEETERFLAEFLPRSRLGAGGRDLPTVPIAEDGC